MTDIDHDAASCSDMIVTEAPRIISAERLNSGVVIRFANGQCGFYPNSFLFAKLPECEELNEADVEW